MNREDGRAKPEIVHESEKTDSPKRNTMNCPRCVLLSLELDAEMDQYHNDHADDETDECGYSETITY
jgi:hypothetical protein